MDKVHCIKPECVVISGKGAGDFSDKDAERLQNFAGDKYKQIENLHKQIKEAVDDKQKR